MKKLITFLCFAAFIIIALLVSNNMTSGFDRAVYGIVTYHPSSLKTNIFKTITFFASEYGVLIVTILCFILIKNKRCVFFIVLSSLITVLSNYLLKVLFMRDRPFELMIISETGYSFPSGHAMLSMGFYGFIIFIIRKFDVRYKNLWSVLLGILIILIGFSRIYLGVHYPSDVLAGYLISFVILMIYTNVVDKYV